MMHINHVNIRLNSFMKIIDYDLKLEDAISVQVRLCLPMLRKTAALAMSEEL